MDNQNIILFQKAYYVLIISQLFGSLLLYHLTLNINTLEKFTRITFQVNVLNIIYNIYRLLIIYDIVIPIDLSYIVSILINLNMVVSVGYHLYKKMVCNAKYLYFVNFDAIILHLYNLIFICIELVFYDYKVCYLYSNLILSIILYIAWAPLYYIYNRWNYNVDLHSVIGIIYLLGIYVCHIITIYFMSNMIKN